MGRGFLVRKCLESFELNNLMIKRIINYLYIRGVPKQILKSDKRKAKVQQGEIPRKAKRETGTPRLYMLLDKLNSIFLG